MAPLRRPLTVALLCVVACARRSDPPLATATASTSAPKPVASSPADASPPEEPYVDEALPKVKGHPAGIDAHALYFADSYDCGEKHACTALYEVLHKGLVVTRIEDTMLRDGYAHVDEELLVGIPYSWYGPTELVIAERKTGKRETIVLWQGYSAPEHVVRDGETFFVTRYDEKSDRTEVLAVRGGPKRSVLRTKGRMASLSLAGDDLEYAVGEEVRRAPKSGKGKETVVKPLDTLHGLACNKFAVRRAVPPAGDELVDNGLCRAMAGDAAAVYWISEPTDPPPEFVTPTTFKPGKPTGKWYLRTLGADGKPKTLGRVAHGGELWLSSEWVYLVGPTSAGRVRR